MTQTEIDWEKLITNDPTLTDKDRALYYVGVAAGLAVISNAISEHITDDLRQKVWPIISKINDDLRDKTKGY